MKSFLNFSRLPRRPHCRPVGKTVIWWVVLQYDKRKPGHTALIVTEDPKRYQQENAVWSTQTIIRVGPIRQQADRLVNLATQDANGKQIRGLVSRGPKLDVLSTKYSLEQFSPGFNAEQRSYKLEDF